MPFRVDAQAIHHSAVHRLSNPKQSLGVVEYEAETSASIIRLNPKAVIRS